MADQTRHLLCEGTLADGESVADYFRRIAREKPNPDPKKRCRDCGQDHRGPIQYWPEDERERHEQAVKYEERENFFDGEPDDPERCPPYE